MEPRNVGKRGKIYKMICIRKWQKESKRRDNRLHLICVSSKIQVKCRDHDIVFITTCVNNAISVNKIILNAAN